MPMKPEIGYPDVVMGSFIEDLIGDLEHNMGLVSANDQYFKELSISPKQHQIQVGKNSNLIADMCWYGATGEELVRAIKHGTVVLDADKHHLDWQKSGEDFGIQELYQKYRRFNRRPKLTEREKLVITAYTGYVLDGTAGKVVDFVETVLGHSIQTPEPPKVPVILEVHNALRGEFCEICRKHHIFNYI